MFRKIGHARFSVFPTHSFPRYSSSHRVACPSAALTARAQSLDDESSRVFSDTPPATPPKRRTNLSPRILKFSVSQKKWITARQTRATRTLGSPAAQAHSFGHLRAVLPRWRPRAPRASRRRLGWAPLACVGRRSARPGRTRRVHLRPAANRHLRGRGGHLPPAPS